MAEKNKLLKKSIIAIVLFGAGLLLLLHYLFYGDFSFTVLSYYHPPKSIYPVYKMIVPGAPVKGEFKAKDNYLGIIGVRFVTFNRENDDILQFKLRQKGTKDWYFQKSYRTTFSNNEFYNFGFQPIPNSDNKTYEFEIVSTRGKMDKAVAISTDQPNLLTKYQYPKQLLLEQKQLLIQHIIKKVVSMLNTTESWFATTAFFLPFLLYVFSQQSKLKRSLSSFHVPIIIILACWNIFFLSRIIDSTLLVVMGFTTVYFWKNLPHKLLFMMAFGLIILTVVLYNIDNDASIRAASWFFSVFIVYIILSLKDIAQNKY